MHRREAALLRKGEGIGPTTQGSIRGAECGRWTGLELLD